MQDEQQLSQEEDQMSPKRIAGTKYIKDIMRSQIDDPNNSRSLSELNDHVDELQHARLPINIQK